MIPLVPVEEARSFLPGGLDLIGQYFSSDQMVDYLRISRELYLDPAVFIVKTGEICIGYIVEGPLLSQKDISARDPPQFITFYSRSILPIFNLIQPNCFSFINHSVLFQVTNQYFELSSVPT